MTSFCIFLFRLAGAWKRCYNRLQVGVLVSGLGMVGVRTAPYICVAIRRTAVRGRLLEASFVCEGLSSKRLQTDFPLNLMHHRALREATA